MTAAEEHARAFFNALFPEVGPNWIAEFRLLPPAGIRAEIARVWHFAHACNGLDVALEANARGYHAYLGVNPRRVMGSAKWADIAAVTVLPLDIDHKKTGISPGAVAADMRAWGLPPSMVIDSGNGGHLYLLLDRPYAVDEARLVAERLCIACSSDEVDDPTRIMRIPGTVNWKAPATWAYIREMNGHRYTLAQVTAALDAVNAPVVDPQAVPIDPPDEPPSAPLAHFVGQLHASLRGVIERGDVPADWPDRSVVQFMACMGLFNAGATFAQVLEAFSVYPLGQIKADATEAQIERTVRAAYSAYRDELGRRHPALRLLDTGYWYYEDGRVVCDKERLRQTVETGVRKAARG